MTTEAQESTEQPEEKSELVEVTFFDHQGAPLTRHVYPEVAKFITSRRQARRDLFAAVRKAERARQLFIWEKEDEFHANPDNQDREFNPWATASDWDRSHPEERRAHYERMYERFVGGQFRDQHAEEQPNSWHILRQEAADAGHEVVVWLVDNTLDNEEEASILVRYLPATVEELWSIAKSDHAMCRIFDQYMERAEEAGVFSDTRVPASLREQRALRNWLRRNYGDGYARDIIPQLKPALRAEREDAIAQARLVWDEELLAATRTAQDMQELLRSLAESHPAIQTHLNRSDGARRAAQTRAANQAVAQESAAATEVLEKVGASA